MVNLSPKSRRIAEAKLKGLKNKDIAKIEYPRAKPKSGEVLVSRQLKKPHVAQYYEQGKDQALAKYHVTWERIIATYANALEAAKMDQFSGEVTPDHSIRMAAATKLKELLPKQPESQNPTTDLSQLLNSNLDEIQLVRLLKTAKTE